MTVLLGVEQMTQRLMGLLSTSQVKAQWQQLLSIRGRLWMGCRICRMVQRLLRKILSDSMLHWQKKRKGATWRRSKLPQLRDWIIWADAQTGTITSFSIHVLTRIVLCLSKMAIPTLAISVSHNHSNHCEMVKKMCPSYEPKCTFFFFWEREVQNQFTIYLSKPNVLVNIYTPKLKITSIS